MRIRHWTPKDLARLRELVAQGVPYARISGILGRGRRACCSAACYYRLSRRGRLLEDPAAQERLRQLHAQGLTDREVAQALGSTRTAVAGWRFRHGLPGNMPTAEQRSERSRESYRRMLHQLGIQALTDCRWELERCTCAEAGWPGARSVAEMRVLQLLEAGEQTRLSVAAALGYQSGDQSGLILKRLVRRGLVALGRKTNGRPRGWHNVYTLAPGVVRGDWSSQVWRPEAAARRRQRLAQRAAEVLQDLARVAEGF